MQNFKTHLMRCFWLWSRMKDAHKRRNTGGKFENVDTCNCETKHGNKSRSTWYERENWNTYTVRISIKPHHRLWRYSRVNFSVILGIPKNLLKITKIRTCAPNLMKQLPKEPQWKSKQYDMGLERIGHDILELWTNYWISTWEFVKPV